MKRALVLGGLVAASLGVGMTGQANACGKGAQHGCASVPSPRYVALLGVTNDFGYWMTYGGQRSTTQVRKLVSQELIDANIQRHLGGSLNTGVAPTSVSRLLARMHLSRFPASYTMTVLSHTNRNAVERIHWQVRGRQDSVVRVNWTYSAIGWSLTGANYLGAH